MKISGKHIEKDLEKEKAFLRGGEEEAKKVEDNYDIKMSK